MSFPSCNFSYNLPHLLSHSHCLFIRTVNLTRDEFDFISRKRETVPCGVPPNKSCEDREHHLFVLLLNYTPSSARSYVMGASRHRPRKHPVRNESRMSAISFLSVNTKSSLVPSRNRTRASRANLENGNRRIDRARFASAKLGRGANTFVGGRSPSRFPQ